MSDPIRVHEIRTIVLPVKRSERDALAELLEVEYKKADSMARSGFAAEAVYQREAEWAKAALERLLALPDEPVVALDLNDDEAGRVSIACGMAKHRSERTEALDQAPIIEARLRVASALWSAVHDDMNRQAHRALVAAAEGHREAMLQRVAVRGLEWL